LGNFSKRAKVHRNAIDLLRSSGLSFPDQKSFLARAEAAAFSAFICAMPPWIA
jgi:hypothetical protein